MKLFQKLTLFHVELQQIVNCEQIWCGDSAGTVYVWQQARTVITASQSNGSAGSVRYVPRSTILLFGIESQRSVTCLLTSGNYVGFCC